jgi:hypothetical protein
MRSGRLAGVVAGTVALMIVRRVLGVLGCGRVPAMDFFTVQTVGLNRLYVLFASTVVDGRPVPFSYPG